MLTLARESSQASSIQIYAEYQSANKYRGRGLQKRAETENEMRLAPSYTQQSAVGRHHQ